MADLKSNNGLVYKELLKNDKLVVLTTADNKLGIYKPTGKQVALLTDAQLGAKVPPKHLQVHSDGKTLFFVDDKGTLQSLDLAVSESKPTPVKEAFQASGRLLPIGEEVYFVDPDGSVDKLKKEQNAFKVVQSALKLPAGREKDKVTKITSCGKDLLLLTLEKDRHLIYNISKAAVAVDEPDLAGFKGYEADYPIYFHEAGKMVFFVSAAAVAQYSIASKKIFTQYLPGQFGKLQTFGIQADKVILVTESHYLGFRIVNEKAKSSEAQLLGAFKFKFAVKYPGAKVFFNLGDMQQVILVSGDQVESVSFSPDWDKVEPVDPNESGHNNSRTGQSGVGGAGGAGGSQAGGAKSVERSQHSEGEEEHEEGEMEEGGQRKTVKKTKKKKVTKKRKRSFDLNGLHHLRGNQYNALKDEHLKPYFYSYRVRDHLVKQSLVHLPYQITRDGYIIENPDEFRKNQMLFREHYKSVGLAHPSKNRRKPRRRSRRPPSPQPKPKNQETRARSRKSRSRSSTSSSTTSSKASPKTARSSPRRSLPQTSKERRSSSGWKRTRPPKKRLPERSRRRSSRSATDWPRKKQTAKPRRRPRRKRPIRPRRSRRPSPRRINQTPSSSQQRQQRPNIS